MEKRDRGGIGPLTLRFLHSPSVPGCTGTHRPLSHPPQRARTHAQATFYKDAATSWRTPGPFGKWRRGRSRPGGRGGSSAQPRTTQKSTRVDGGPKRLPQSGKKASQKAARPRALQSVLPEGKPDGRGHFIQISKVRLGKRPSGRGQTRPRPGGDTCKPRADKEPPSPQGTKKQNLEGDKDAPPTTPIHTALESSPQQSDKKRK